MEMLLMLIGLMLATVVVGAIGHRTGLPWPALLTILTALVVFIPGLPTIEIPTELILPIFLPPLLWALARRTSWGVIRGQWIIILSLSIILVVLTTFAVGMAAYFLLPSISIAAAILIGAAIAPPDPVAVEAVAEPAGIPKRITTTLQTEGLFNDAASIVAFHLALFAVTEGDDLTWGSAITQFSYSAIVAAISGLVIGRAAAWFLTHVHEVIARNALTWVIPFATYIIAEELHASGVIAVVIAAVELHSRADIHAEDRLSGRSFWETVELLFTGVAFGLIGLSVHGAIQEVGSDLWHSVFVGVALSCTAFIVRLLWMYVLYRINKTKARRDVAPLRLQEVLLMTWSGMRGLVTLALVLSIPSGYIAFHHEFTVIALTVLLVTMVIPGLLLPWLMRKLDLDSSSQAAHDQMVADISKRAKRAALVAVQKQYQDLDPEIAANIDIWLQERFATGDATELQENLEKVKTARTLAADARRAALRAAQAELLQIRRQRTYNPAVVDEVLSVVDRMSVGTV